ncbi:MAG: cell division protein ZapE, partial [Deltaproteobacteria bacterium]
LIAKKKGIKFIICLDEFLVSDIGDAMILSELFKYFFYYEIYFVITSNVIPKNLYINGLQRQKFISTIDLIYKHLEVLNISGDLDYRFRSLEKEDVFLYPVTMFNLKRLRNLFFRLVTVKPERKKVISILNRDVKSIYFSGSIVWFDFNVICGDGRSQMDYIELALMFDIVFISNVRPVYFDDDRCKRFIMMIDEFYDSKISVIILLDCYFDNLYSGTRLKFEFKRTCSRLFEMGTKNYLKNLKK